jgi:hypothetical protein
MQKTEKKSYSKPWIVWRRALGVLVPVARCKHEDSARKIARKQGGAGMFAAGYYARVDELDASTKLALGVRG